MKALACLLAAGMALPAPSRAQGVRELLGRVELVDSAGKAAGPGAIVTVTATIQAGQYSGVANSTGFFRIALPAQVRSGDRINFQADRQGYSILQPYGGLERVPSDLRRDHIVLTLAPHGSPVFMSGDQIMALIQRAAEADRERTDRSREAPRLRYYIEQWAVEKGFSATQVEEEVARWVKSVRERPEEIFQNGLAAYAENRLADAAARFQESGEQNERTLEEVVRTRVAAEAEERKFRERVIRDYRLRGDALLYSDDYPGALAAFQRALSHATRDRDSLAWGDVQNDLGRAHRALATVSEGAAIREHLDQSMAFHDRALEVFSRTTAPLAWAQTHLHRGYTLSFYADLDHGPAARAQTEKALASYIVAFQAFWEQKADMGIIESLLDVGGAFGQLADFASGEQADSLTTLSIDAYEAVVQSVSRSQLPREWARARVGAGRQRRSLAFRSDRARAKTILKEEIGALRDVLSSLAGDTVGTSLAHYRMDLASALATLAGFVPSDSAVLLLRQARDELGSNPSSSRERDPGLWAFTQSLSGSINLELGRHDAAGADSAWRSALRSFRAAQTRFTREAFPQIWASLQISVSATLLRHARIQPRAVAMASLSEGKSAVESALALESDPVGIAISNFNIGIITTMQGDYAVAESAYARARADIPLRARADLDVALLALRSAIDFQAGKTDSIPARLQRIVDLVAQQESGYYIEQSVRGGQLFIVAPETAPSPRQAWLVEFFTAFQATDRDTLLADLRALQRKLQASAPVAGGG